MIFIRFKLIKNNIFLIKMKITKKSLKIPRFVNKKLSQICCDDKSLCTLNPMIDERKSRKRALTERRKENFNIINNITNNILSNKVPKNVSSYKIKKEAKLFDHDFSFTKIIYPYNDISNSQRAFEINKKETKNYMKRPKSFYIKRRKKILEQPNENHKNMVFKPVFENYIMKKKLKKQNDITYKNFKNMPNNKEVKFNESFFNHKNEFIYNFIKDTKNIHYISSTNSDQRRQNSSQNRFLLFTKKNDNSKLKDGIIKSNKTIQSRPKNKINRLDKNKNDYSLNIFNKQEKYNPKRIYNELDCDDKKLIKKLLKCPESVLYQIYQNTSPANIVPEIYLSKKTVKEKFNYFKKDLKELENEANEELAKLKKQLSMSNKSNTRGIVKSSNCFLDLAFG